MPERGGSGRIPKTLLDFQQHFPNEEAFIAHLRGAYEGAHQLAQERRDTGVGACVTVGRR